MGNGDGGILLYPNHVVFLKLDDIIT